METTPTTIPVVSLNAGDRFYAGSRHVIVTSVRRARPTVSKTFGRTERVTVIGVDQYGNRYQATSPVSTNVVLTNR